MLLYTGAGNDAEGAEDVVGPNATEDEVLGCPYFALGTSAVIMVATAIPVIVDPVAAAADVVKDVGAFSNPFGGDKLDIVSEE